MRFLLSFFFLFTVAFAQMPSFSLSGSVQDKKTKAVMEYCTVSLYKTEDKSLVTGMVSDFNGDFILKNLKPGSYYLEVSFIGFEPKIIRDLSLNRENQNLNIGVVYLGADATQINEVEVTALKSSVRYELDKKIVDVDKNIAATNGTAADILATVPSVTTDIDGNVSLRGSSSFKVLINGIPSVLSANDALQQIPASTIQNIEIITNPSARYDAEGAAGIINIITKKNSQDGFTGIANVRGGTFSSYGGDLTLSLRKKKFTYTLTGDYNHNSRPGSYFSDLNTTIGDTTVSTINEGTQKRSFARYGVKANIEYRPTEKQYLSFSYRYSSFEMETDNVLDFSFINRTTGEIEQFTNINKSQRAFPRNVVAFNYGYDFTNKSKLSAHFSYNFRTSNESVFNDRVDDLDQLLFSTRSTESGPSNRFRMNIDYEIPIQENSKFEFGMMQEINRSDEENRGFQLNILSEEYEIQSEFSNDVANDISIRAFYGIFSSKWNKLAYQIGVRSEKTNRDILVKTNGNNYKINRLDLFPSIHVSFDQSKEHQFFVSYSKRIQRPRGWYLEPNTIYTDANTLFSGNPDILPEYIHALEAGWLFSFKKKGSWNNEVYFRREENVIQFVRIPLDFELTQQFPENIGNSNSVGIETSLSLLPTKWWNTDLMANLFYFNLKGAFADEVYDRSSFSYILRWNNYFKLTKSTKLQFNGSYESPIVNAQGRTKYTVRFDAGLKQELLNKKLSLGVQVRDLFNTYIRENELEGSNFDYIRINNPLGPSIVFSVSYKINNYKPSRSKYNEGGGDF